MLPRLQQYQNNQSILKAAKDKFSSPYFKFSFEISYYLLNFQQNFIFSRKIHVLSIFPQGAKNHGVVMPDANKENTLNQLVGAAFGAAGQRCMALSTAILVGEAKKWLPELVERAKNLRVNAGNRLSAQLLQTLHLWHQALGFNIGFGQWEQSYLF